MTLFSVDSYVIILVHHKFVGLVLCNSIPFAFQYLTEAVVKYEKKYFTITDVRAQHFTIEVPSSIVE